MPLESYLDQAVKKVCPIYGISFGNLDDKTTWRIDYDESATDAQKKSAEIIVNEFVWDATTQEIDRKNIRNDKYKDDLVMKQGYANYKISKPDASFSDYLDYLETI